MRSDRRSGEALARAGLTTSGGKCKGSEQDMILGGEPGRLPHGTCATADNGRSHMQRGPRLLKGAQRTW